MVNNFPLNDFEKDFPFIDNYAISEIVWKFNCFYGEHIETQQSLKAIIRHMYIKTKTSKMLEGFFFAIFFVVPFVWQLNTLDFEKTAHNHEPTRICMYVCMAYQVLMALISIVLIKAGGWSFFTKASNIADILMITLYTTYFCLANSLMKNAIIPYHEVMTAEDSWISVLMILILFTMLFQIAKDAEIYGKFSILTRMFTRCVYDVVPFTVFLITWNLFFSIAFRLMGVTYGDSIFPNLIPFFQYFTLSFENSMGNITTPQLSDTDYSANYA